MSDEPDIGGKKKGGLLGKIFMLLGFLIFAGGGFAGGVFYSDQRLSPSEEVLKLIERHEEAVAAEEAAAAEAEAGPKKVVKEQPEEPVFATNYFEFPEPLTTNLKDSRRFLQLGVGISTQYDESVIANVEAHSMALQSDMLAVISGFSETDLQGKTGRDKLSKELMDAINARLVELEGFGGIEDVFFPSFVLQ